MRFLLKLIGRTKSDAQLSVLSCVDFHDGSIHKQSVDRSNCIKQESGQLRVCCAQN